MAATTKMRPLLACVACLAAVCFYADAKPKYVNTVLNAKWSSTPLLMETSEFVAKESNDIFWSYVNDIADMDPASIGNVIDNEETMYHLALKVAARYLTPLRVNLLKFALSLRSHSPAVEMFSMMANEKNPPEECESFIEIHDLVTCETAAAKAFIKLASGPGTRLIKTDHRYPRSGDSEVTMVLYGRLGEPSCSRKHKELRALAEAGKIHYVFRHYMRVPSKIKTRLSGYGVELAIKNQEYKAKDDTKVEVNEEENKEDSEEEVQGFMFSQLKTLHPEMAEDLKAFRTHLEESDNKMTPLKVWQLQDLSFQAAQRIMAAPPNEALKVMRDISQNFPVRARSLATTVVQENMRTEITKNQRVFESTLNIGQGEAALLINGMQVDMEVYDVFSLLDMLKADGKLMEGLHALGLKDKTLSGLLKVDLSDSGTNYAVDFRDSSVVYVNNIEKDRKYSGWPSSMQEMLRPTFPGMLRHVRKNFFHLVYFINPADSKQREVVKMAEAFYVHSAPIRIGLVFVVNPDPEADATTDAGVAMLRAFSFITKLHSPTKALSFITDVYERVGDGEISANLVMQEFSSTYPMASAGDVFGINSQYDKWRKECHEFFTKTGLGKAPQVLINGVPLRKEEILPDGIEEAVVSGILRSTPELQKDIYNGKLYDGMNILDYLMSQPNVMPRLNSRILSPSEQYLDFTKDTDAKLVHQPETFERLPGTDMTAAMMDDMHYLTKKDDEVVRAVTVWVVADLETPEGRNMAYNAVKHMKHTNGLRLGIVHNSVTLPTSVDADSHFISKAVYVAIETLTPSIARSFVTKLLKEENVAALAAGTKTLDDLEVNKMDMAAYKSNLAKENLSFLLSHRAFCNSVLSFRAGQRGVVTNGKVLGPLQDTESFLTEDFSLLDKYTQKTYADKIKALINEMGLDYDKASDLVMRVSSLLNSVSRSDTRRDIEYHTDRHSVVNLPGDSDKPAYDIVAIIDPATRAAQKYAPILMVLQQVVNCNIRIFMNCKEKLSESPLKSFYRFVLDPEVTFNIRSEYVTGPMARFANVAQKPLLTLGMDLPESWLVEVVRSPYDLDNIYLEEVNSGVNAEFELEYLLLEGHCYDTSSGQPPRGLQFILGTSSAPAMVDTIVMANLGYFQLKANPGAWNLQLRPGRSFDIYDITSHEYTDSPSDSSEVLVVLDSFKSKIIKLRVNKKAGMEKEDLLGGENEPSGIWDSISSELFDILGLDGSDNLDSAPEVVRSFTGRSATGDDKEETLNIFSVASGHLYERFLRIMMTSVLKHTQSRVKFWFLKNFLSPTFKDFIPHMAKKYNFDYELVQYKWPRWLHQQREKQRIIWGYKILFLDVLFPLDVDKIIFVDADQIVRTDLKELHDFDLEGAPYGYTPFCDSKREMDGFRFWKSGYWASHLAGRKYHISALYVVDLKKFRKVAAGDRLRGQYQGLSQDPNSLSNLDQDLPNNMIHQVSIKSLPQEWLWCETWCGQDEKPYAKTIDLCNNPLTKEPKLEAAMRIVPEWNDYDAEIKTLWDEVQRAGKFIDEESIEAPAQQGSTARKTEL